MDDDWKRDLAECIKYREYLGPQLTEVPMTSIHRSMDFLRLLSRLLGNDDFMMTDEIASFIANMCTNELS